MATLDNNQSPKPFTEDLCQPKSNTHGSCSILMIIFLLIFAAIVVVGGKILWGSIQTLKTQNNAMQANYVGLQIQIKTLEENIQNQQKILGDLQNQTTNLKLNKIYTETIYLIKNADYQIKLHNLDGALMLLQATNETFRNISNPKPLLNSIQKEISEIIQLLKTTQKSDESSIVEQIDQLKQNIDQLPLNLPKTSSINMQTTASDHETRLSEMFKEIWRQIHQLIIIRHYDKAIEPLITPNQTVYLQQNLQLQLEEATLAVFYHNPALYQLSLEKAQTWVKKFFDPNAKQTQVFLSQLDALQKTRIIQTTSEIESRLNKILNQLTVLLQSTIKASSHTHEEEF